jgi:uncharacterized protein
MNEIKNSINKDIPDILKNYKNIAIVGLSDKPDRTSYRVGAYIKKAGYHIIPVNPNYESVMDLKCYNTLEEIPEPVDIVNIFRKSEDVLSVVQDAIKINAKVVWMQLGIVNEEAAKLALDAGLQVIMNRCIKIEHSML